VTPPSYYHRTGRVDIISPAGWASHPFARHTRVQRTVWAMLNQEVRRPRRGSYSSTVPDCWKNRGIRTQDATCHIFRAPPGEPEFQVRPPQLSPAYAGERQEDGYCRRPHCKRKLVMEKPDLFFIPAKFVFHQPAFRDMAMQSVCQHGSHQE